MNGLVLKLVAMLTMLIDHIGVVFVPYGSPLWFVCRCMGRLSYPLFAFLLAEGYFYTKDAKRYLFRLFGFALISEIPFDTLFTGQYVYWRQQNVFVTLFLGLLGIMLFDLYARRDNAMAALLCMAAAAVGAVLCRSDYGAYGILFIFVFYRYRGQPKSLILWYGLAMLLYAGGSAVSILGAESLALSWGLVCLCQFFALPLILAYNKKKGYKSRSLQYLFYAFYPLHMMLLFALRMLLIR